MGRLRVSHRRKGGGRLAGKGSRRWNTLTGRLAYLVTCTFLPVNLLAIIVSGMILLQAAEQIQDARQRELDMAMNRMAVNLERLEEDFSGFLVSYMTELTLASKRNQLAEIEMLGRLKEMEGASGMAGLVWLGHKGEGRVFVRSSSGRYAVTWVEELKEALRAGAYGEKGESAENPGAWQIGMFAGKRFLYRKYEYTNYEVGFLLDLEEELELLGSSGLWTSNQVFLESGGTLYSFRNGKLTLSREESWHALFRERRFGRNVQWAAEGFDLRVGVRVTDQGYGRGVPTLYRVLMLLSLGSVLLAFFMWRGLQKRVLNSLGALYLGMQELEKEHLEYRITGWNRKETGEFIFLYKSFNRMAAEIGVSREKDAKMYQAQLDNLRLQVNPHMLLNSFNMIYSLAQSRNFQCIQEYSLLLVEYFRYSLKETNRFVPLEKELEFVENYIAIQKIRFPGAFTSVHNVQENCRNVWVPPLLIENFVENSMKYALIPGKTIEVLINIRRQEQRLLISVCDTGRGIKQEILERLQKGQVYRDRMGKDHIGVWNCRRRLEVFYGGDASMSIVSSPGEGTQVWLDLPFREDGLSEEEAGQKETEAGREVRD